MNAQSFCGRFFPYPIPRRTAIMLVALTLSCLTSSCGRKVDEIHDAAQIGDLDKVKALLNRNPDLVFSKSGDYGETPLHAAALWGHKSVAAYLLMHRADVNAKNNYGVTPLHEAAGNGHVEVAKLLLVNKADVNAGSTNGGMPLLIAVANNHKDTVELLLAYKAKVNAKDYKGRTPLHEAASRGRHREVVELLLAHQADVNAKDDDGSTPLHLAVATDRNGVAELRRQHGGHE